MAAFAQPLRATVTENLRAHPRNTLALEGRKHAAVAVVIAGEVRAEAGQLQDLIAPAPPGDGPEAAFLLCRRPSRMRRHAGQWALPGGRLEPGEEPLDAALRELEEELGIGLGPAAVLGWLDDYGTRSGYVISPVVLWAEGAPALVPDPAEVAATYRVTLSALLGGEPSFLETTESERPILQLPLGDELIHAPTAAILLQFRQVGLEGRIGETVDWLEEPRFAWR